MIGEIEIPSIVVTGLMKEFSLSHMGNSGIKSRMLSLVRTRQDIGGGRFGIRKNTMERRRVLDGITFQIRRGETVGLIGKNGSGKSTLLGILARIYRPNAGTVLIDGRVIALLELGAGFHQELTGTENVYFNGAILGLTREQISDRFDSIVAFAELDSSIDSPVRNYSSGMLLRLGFSIAVHVDAEVILIDEALAVGDEAFQKKCFDKIIEFQRLGITIVVVTHEMDDLQRVAQRIMWLKDGRIFRDGAPANVLPEYFSEMRAETTG